MAVSLLYAILFSVSKFHAEGSSIVVNTTSGWYKGKIIDMGNQRVYAFLNVTYGQPPIGANRFRPPQRAPYSNGIIQADRLAQACYQLMDKTYPGFEGTEMWNPEDGMTESCLTLNIWTPVNAHNSPVLVWIFGGGFASGSPSLYLYNGSTLAALYGTIVVNINYRLNIFGFFFLNDRDAPPNVGLLDQRMALQWIQENIANFGGDPSQVTIMGESSGGASVMAHLHAVDSWPLFKYAIVQSGSMNLPWASVEKTDLLKHSIIVAHQLGCNGSESRILDCLREQSPTKILGETEKVRSSAFLHFYFVPVLDDELFFGKKGYENFMRSITKNTSILLGYNEDEGSFWLPTWLTQFFNITTEQTAATLPEMTELVNVTFSFLTEEQRSQAISHYKYKTSDVRKMLSSMVGDYYFTCGVLDLADSLADHNIPVYLFNFNYRSESNPWPQWMGVMHGYEIEFIFGGPLNRKGESLYDDIKMSRTLMEYWNSFIRHGIPLATSPGATHWPAYTKENGAYTSFGKNGTMLKLKPLRNSCGMFKHLSSDALSTAESGLRKALRWPYYHTWIAQNDDGIFSLYWPSYRKERSAYVRFAESKVSVEYGTLPHTEACKVFNGFKHEWKKAKNITRFFRPCRFDV